MSAAQRVSGESVMAPGEVVEIVYPPAGKLFVLRMRGAELGSARRLDVELRTTGGVRVGAMEDVPFDAARGEVLVACQSHFAESFPPDVVFGLDVVTGDERRRVAEYTVLHRFA
jgi:hypothetical protein